MIDKFLVFRIAVLLTAVGLLAIVWFPFIETKHICCNEEYTETNSLYFATFRVPCGISYNDFVKDGGLIGCGAIAVTILSLVFGYGAITDKELMK